MNPKTLSQRLASELSKRALKDTPPFRLALNVDMPQQHELDHANLTFRFYDFECAHEGEIQISPIDSKHEGYRWINTISATG